MKKLHGNGQKSTAELTARQEHAIQALLTGASVREAANNTHIGRTTLYRWLNNDAAFRAAYRTAQERSQAWTVNRLQHLTAKAIQVLEQILDDGEVPTLTKIEAARAILNFALAGKEHAIQRGSLGPLKSELSLTALHLEPTLPAGRVTVLEQATHKWPAHPRHGS